MRHETRLTRHTRLLLTSFALPGPGRKEARSIDRVSGQYREEYCFHHWLTT